MINRITLEGVLLADPKIRTYEKRGQSFEVVSIWLETKSGERADRISAEINCPKSGEAAKKLRQGVIAEIEGALRHDRYIAKATGAWTSKVYVAIDPGCGHVRSKGRYGAEEFGQAA